MIVLKFFTYLEARTLLHPLPGSTFPSPSKSGLRSRWPHTRAFRNCCSSWYTSRCRAERCSGVRVSFDFPGHPARLRSRYLSNTCCDRGNAPGSSRNGFRAQYRLSGYSSDSPSCGSHGGGALQSLGSKRTALPRGAAMHHDVVDFSHKIS